MSDILKKILMDQKRIAMDVCVMATHSNIIKHRAYLIIVFAKKKIAIHLSFLLSIHMYMRMNFTLSSPPFMK